MTIDEQIEDSRTVVTLTPHTATIDNTHQVPIGTDQSPRSAAVAWIAHHRANELGQPVPVRAHEADGAVYDFVVAEDGTLGDIRQIRAGDGRGQAVHQTDNQPATRQPQPVAHREDREQPTFQPPRLAQPQPRGATSNGQQWPPARSGSHPAPEARTAPDDLHTHQEAVADQAAPGRRAEGDRMNQPAPQASPDQTFSDRPMSFLGGEPRNNDDTAIAVAPARPAKWWQRLFGTAPAAPTGPTPEELAIHSDQRAVSQPWLDSRCVAIANGKGGSGKSPTTAMLAAVFARYGGGGVAAWDNNETRGTLGWRTEQSPHHDATVQTLIPATQALMDPRAALSEISAYVHHQSDDRYDVLRSDPALLAADQRLTTAQFHSVHEVLRRYYRLTLIDSSNDESSYNYLNMIEAADQIVVPTTTSLDHAEAGRLLLQALGSRGDAHSVHLAQSAVVIVAQADREERDAETVADMFRQMLPPEAVITLPFDHGLRCMQLRHDNLTAVTQRGYLRAAAEIAQRLSQRG